MGTCLTGSYESLYGYMSAVLLVYDSIVKLEPRQHVSALESDSLFDVVPGIVGVYQDVMLEHCLFHFLLDDFITATSLVPLTSQLTLLVFLDLTLSCSFLPPSLYLHMHHYHYFGHSSCLWIWPQSHLSRPMSYSHLIGHILQAAHIQLKRSFVVCWHDTVPSHHVCGVSQLLV